MTKMNSVNNLQLTTTLFEEFAEKCANLTQICLDAAKADSPIEIEIPVDTTICNQEINMPTVSTFDGEEDPVQVNWR